MSILVRNATRRFGDFTALDDVSVEIPSGSLTALLVLLAMTRLPSHRGTPKEGR
jgi:ABC-type enterochelin transport system ATPase subunit